MKVLGLLLKQLFDLLQTHHLEVILLLLWLVSFLDGLSLASPLFFLGSCFVGNVFSGCFLDIRLLRLSVFGCLLGSWFHFKFKL